MLDLRHPRWVFGPTILFTLLLTLVADAAAQLRVADRGRWRGVRNGGPVGSGGYHDATRNLSVLPAETELREWDLGATSLSSSWGTPAYVAICEFPRSTPGAGLAWDEQLGTRLYAAGGFTQLVAPGQPAVANVALHRMVFDASNGEAVLLTMTRAATLQCWRFDGAWRSMPTPPHFDPVFAFGGLVYDPVRRSVVALTDQGCWLFASTGTQWNSAPAPSGPLITERALCWDERRGRIVGFGGRTGPNQWVDDTIEWTGSQWITVSTVIRPTRASGGIMMFDRMLQVCLLFGGDSQFGPLDEVSAYTGSSWSSWSVSSVSPQARHDAMLADDPRGAILFGGATGTGTPLNDTWLWTGEAWQSLGGSAPGARWAGAMARLTTSSILLFGGVDGSAVLGDTWVLDAPPNAGWRQLQTGTAPAIRFNHAMAANPQGSSVYLFGGTDSAVRYGDFWTFSVGSGNWQQITAGNAPPARDIHAMTFGSVRRKLVLFGGRDAAGTALADTWEFDIASSTWARRTPATQPRQRVNHVLVYDSVRQRTVLIGGYDWAGTFLSDIHEWDGIRWAQRTPATQGIPEAENMAGAFDSRTGRTVLFGGLYGFGGPVGNRTHELHEHVGKSALGQSHPIDLTITSQPAVGFGQAPLGVSVPSNAGLAVLLVDAGLAAQPLFVGQPPLFCVAQEVYLQGALQLPLSGSPVATLQLTLPLSTGGRTISLQAASVRNSSCLDVTDAWFTRIRQL
jgi:hypothetical protein